MKTFPAFLIVLSIATAGFFILGIFALLAYKVHSVFGTSILATFMLIVIVFPIVDSVKQIHNKLLSKRG